jgi:insecticidal toxin complex protein TccC
MIDASATTKEVDMPGSALSVHRATPTLAAHDPRRLVVREIGFCCSQPGTPADLRITRQFFDSAGRQVACQDPRLGLATRAGGGFVANLAEIHSLSGLPLSSASADAGWRVSLLGEAQVPSAMWDSRGQARYNTFDGSLRLTSVSERSPDGGFVVAERLVYGPASENNHNLSGRLMRHDDGAGVREVCDYGFGDCALVEHRRFLQDLNMPDWPLDIGAREALLETQTATTERCVNALGEQILQIDTRHNIQRFHHDIAGHVHQVFLQSGDAEPFKISQLSFNALDQVERETGSNGVVSLAHYSPQDGRLLRLEAGLPDQPLLQCLEYVFDPVGNVTLISDTAQATAYFRNQRIDPISTYCYDSLSQLIEASGYESIQAHHWQRLAGHYAANADPASMTHYLQKYEYDAAGNLHTVIHSGDQSFTQRNVISASSNRGLQVQGAWVPDEQDIVRGFDLNGNQLELVRGQQLHWDSRNQLRQVAPIVRDAGQDDCEQYVYDSKGQRLRKVQLTLAKGNARTREVRYLPGLQLHMDSVSGKAWHVVELQVGRHRVSWTRWESVPPQGVEKTHGRYSLTDHLGSATLELDEKGNLISLESYYPYAGTACWTLGASASAGEKSRRYSGKEQDATGLYYYGLRYYAPWLGRWINPDPGGGVDGLNRYRFVRNNPLTLQDPDGLASVTLLYGFEDARELYLDELGPQADTSIIRIDSINRALGLDFSAVNTNYPAALERVRSGIQPADIEVEDFVDIYQPYYHGSVQEAGEMLMGWSRFLSQNAGKLDIDSKLSRYREAGQTEKIEGFWKKNSFFPVSGNQGDEFTERFLADPRSFFENPGAEAGEALTRWFFRGTSKLGLDWVDSGAVGSAESVWFLNVEKDRTQGKSAWKDIDMDRVNAQPYKRPFFTGTLFEPVTFSEKRHVIRRGYDQSGRVRFIDAARFRKTLEWD